MISAEQLEAWRGKPVLDPGGETIGKLEEVYLDRTSGDPILVAVKSGMLGRRVSLVPVNGATVGPDYVRVAHAVDTVKQAEGAGDAPPSNDELNALGEVYGLRFADGLTLDGAGDIAARRAAAQDARDRAAELQAIAEGKAQDRDAARERATGAGVQAGQAEREAEEARRAAEAARAEADQQSTP